jgi:hypothetical protein
MVCMKIYVNFSSGAVTEYDISGMENPYIQLQQLGFKVYKKEPCPKSPWGIGSRCCVRRKSCLANYNKNEFDVAEWV